MLSASRVNGPGSRFVVWVQGCSRHCPGCFNPLTHDRYEGVELSTHEIIETIPLKDVEGITVSGGEPFEQPEALADLLEAAKGLGLHRLVYTGFSYEELIKMAGNGITESLFLTDLLIDGAYQRNKPANVPWAGSGNQRILELCNGKIRDKRNFGKNVFDTAGNGEIYIDTAGNIIATGIFDSRNLQREVSAC
ncbi:anaerobic ribonucleoside-triphosphate reductase activating protein [Spirochaetia bacterium]|nr:anaerobic ribonucleoside-triphosphate reductase activating protein [Spirochaetia bacterium]